ncbi:fasciclin domain-containing protein [Photobacterium sp. SP02]|uniref:fasciclin domain-containing protein n=1 Tax=Photobacterium sp. SP02 TaxID=3032280 RepID=UPI0031452B7F
MKRFIHAFVSALIIIITVGFNNAYAAQEQTQVDKNLVKVAATNDNFQTLVMAIRAADLTGTLEGKGPFTLLAPTDEAFEMLPEGTLAELLKPENKEKLQKLITYHLLPSAISSSAASQLKQPETVEGHPLTIENTDDGIRINGAKVIEADIPATNGVIHVIDKVLIPPAE